MQPHQAQQSSAESRPRSTHNLNEGLPELGELVPVDSFFHRYMDLLGVGRQPGSMPPGSEAGAANPHSQASSFPGQQAQTSTGPSHQPQPNFRYPATVNYLAQLTGRDLHQHNNSQPRSSLPVEQLDTSLQNRQDPGQPGFPPPHRGSPQPDVLSYPSSSLAHFQQYLQAQAGNTHMLGPSMGDPSGLLPGHIPGLPHSHIPGLPLSNPVQSTLQAVQHWQNPNTAGKSSQDQNQSNPTSNVDTSQAVLSPGYPAGGRHPLASASSPPSRARTQEVPGGGSRGLPGGSRGSQSDMEDDGQSTGSRLPSGALSRTNRTPRQQLQNKQAQQRYRERRKMKVTEMEQALAAMSQQVDELQGVLKQNVALQDKTLRLEQMLSERDTKIEQLANQLKSASAQPASLPDQDPARDPEEARKQGTSALDGMSHLKLEFQGQIMKLQQWIEAHNLRHADPFGNGVPREVIAHLTEMVEDGLRVCRKVQAEGIQVLDLITHSPSSLDEMGTAQEREKWVAAVRAVKMTPLQTEQLLLWRTEHLRNMHAIYEQRQQLNLQAVQKMNPGAENEPLTQRNSAKLVEAMEKEGYLPTAKANLELTESLEKIKENLKFEQRSVLQFNWVLVHRILSPIQVALFMVQAWPSHCDCLAMVNTVNSLKDELMAGASGGVAMSTSSQHITQTAAANEPMDMDPHPTTAFLPTASTTPHGPSQTAGAEGPAPQSRVHSGQQASPFASAFRPVIPRREGGSLPRILPAAAHSAPGLFQFAPARGPDAPALSPRSSQQPSANPPGHAPAPQKPVGSSMSTQGPHTNHNASPQNPSGQVPSQHNPTGHNLSLQRPMAPPPPQSHAAVAVTSGQTSAAQVPSQQQVSMPASSQQRQSSASESVASQGMSSDGPTPQNEARQAAPPPGQHS